jgi:hypothetical protein
MQAIASLDLVLWFQAVKVSPNLRSDQCSGREAIQHGSKRGLGDWTVCVQMLALPVIACEPLDYHLSEPQLPSS